MKTTPVKSSVSTAKGTATKVAVLLLILTLVCAQSSLLSAYGNEETATVLPSSEDIGSGSLAEVAAPQDDSLLDSGGDAEADESATDESATDESATDESATDEYEEEGGIPLSLLTQEADTLQDDLTPLSVDSFEQLQAALATAASGDTIEIESSFSLTSKLTIPTGITIALTSAAGGPFTLTRSAYTGTLFELAPGAKLAINNLTIDGGGLAVAGVNGSIILATASSELTLNSGASLKNNIKTSGSGGAILTSGTNVSLVFNAGCLIDGNKAITANGGAVCAPSQAGSVTDSATATINGGVFSNNEAYVGGAFAFGVNDALTMYNGQIVRNKDTGYFGGGIACYGQLAIHGGLISENSASRGGGGVAFSSSIGSSSFVMTGGTISKNNTSGGPGYGGGISLSLGNQEASSNCVSITGGVIGGTSAAEANFGSSGGGLAIVYFGSPIASGSLPITLGGSVLISNNNATRGGGIFISNELGASQSTDMEPITITDDAQISYNRATQVGGIFASTNNTTAGKNLEIFISGNASVHHNVASAGPCGGIYASGQTLTLSDNVTVYNNTSTTGGGGLFASERTTLPKTETYVHVAGSVSFSHNSAPYGGGVYASGGAELFFADQASIEENIGDVGGGMYNYGAAVTFTGACSISNNKANLDGKTFWTAGALYLEGDAEGNLGTVSLADNCVIAGNTAENDIGGVYIYDGGVLALQDSASITGNTFVNPLGVGTGVYLAPEGILEVSGTPRIGIDSADNGVTLEDGAFVSIPAGQDLLLGARINIDALESGPADGALVAKRVDGSTAANDESVYFAYLEDSGYMVARDSVDPSAYVLAVAHVVTFFDWDSTILKTELVAHGGAATAPASPTRTDYSHIGWSADFSNVTSDLTVTANYEMLPPSANVSTPSEPTAQIVAPRTPVARGLSATGDVLPLVVLALGGLALLGIALLATRKKPHC